MRARTKIIIFYVRKRDDVEVIESLQISSSEIIEKIESITPDLNHIQVLNLVSRIESLDLCFGVSEDNLVP